MVKSHPTHPPPAERDFPWECCCGRAHIYSIAVCAVGVEQTLVMLRAHLAQVGEDTILTQPQVGEYCAQHTSIVPRTVGELMTAMS